MKEERRKVREVKGKRKNLKKAKPEMEKKFSTGSEKLPSFFFCLKGGKLHLIYSRRENKIQWKIYKREKEESKEKCLGERKKKKREVKERR